MLLSKNDMPQDAVQLVDLNQLLDRVNPSIAVWNPGGLSPKSEYRGWRNFSYLWNGFLKWKLSADTKWHKTAAMKYSDL